MPDSSKGHSNLLVSFACNTNKCNAFVGDGTNEPGDQPEFLVQAK